MKFDPHLSIEDGSRPILPIASGDASAAAFAPTIATGHPSLEGDTVLDRGGARSHAGGNALIPGARSTVLPRIEIIGSETTFVVDNKRRFEYLGRLGAGGAGEVMGAQDHDIGRQVALKRLHPDTGSASSLVRFVEEIRTIGRLEHPNIIPIHDVGLDEEGEYYFVMKYVDGETLEKIIAMLAAGDPEYHRRYTFERRVEIWKSVLEAVAFAHDKGIIHRDIKPANVMVGRYGEVLLMDWGIAKAIRGPDTAALTATAEEAPAEGAAARKRLWQTQVGALIGTPAYMSPEQVRGKDLDERSDIYSLCLLFYELLSLTHPLTDKDSLPGLLLGVVEDEVPPVRFVKSPHQPPVPVDLDWLVLGGLAKDPKARYPSVNAIIARLDRRAEGDIPMQCGATCLLQVTNKWSRLVTRHPRAAMMGISGALLALLALVVYRVVAA